MVEIGLERPKRCEEGGRRVHGAWDEVGYSWFVLANIGLHLVLTQVFDSEQCGNVGSFRFLHTIVWPRLSGSQLPMKSVLTVVLQSFVLPCSWRFPSHPRRNNFSNRQVSSPLNYSNHATYWSIGTSYISPYAFTRILIPLLQQTAKEPNSDVRIVNVRSKRISLYYQHLNECPGYLYHAQDDTILCEVRYSWGF